MANGSEQATPVDSIKDVVLWRFLSSTNIWRTYLPKCYGNNNKDEDNGLKTPNDENHQASSQKFRQLMLYILRKKLKKIF